MQPVQRVIIVVAQLLSCVLAYQDRLTSCILPLVKPDRAAVGIVTTKT
jgi:hypothetical protein